MKPSTTKRGRPQATRSALCVTVLLAAMSTAFAADDGNWTEYTGDKAGSRYLPSKSVTTESVKSMKVAWRWAMPDNAIAADNAELRTWVNESTPLAIDGILYSTSPMSTVSAIDGETGKTLWTYDPEAYKDGTPPNLGFINRGLTYWADGDDKRIIVGTGDGYLIALNATTGKPIESWGEQGRVDLTKGMRRRVDRSLIAVTSPPIVCGDTVVPSIAVLDSFAIGRQPMKYHPPGDVQAFDVRTGKRVWIFEQPPQKGQPGNETWEDESWKTTGSGNMWARPGCDEELGLVYLPFSTPTNDFYGGHRKGDGLFGESLVAVDAKSGKLAWYYQMVRHGLWDYDLPTAPNLMDLTVNGKKIKAVAQVTKQGFVFTFDRATGKPVWPIEDRAVPQSTVPGERSAATQPHPTVPAPFVQQGVTEDDLIDLTPQLKEEARKILARYNYGPLYTPPTLDKAGTLQVPGVLGGASWAGAAHNPNTNVLYVPSFTIPFGIKIKKENASVYDYTGTWAGVGGPQGLPLFKPPFSTVTAIDMNTGKHLWRIPAGKGPVDHPAIKDLNLGRVGVPRESFIALTDEVLFLAPEGTHGVIGLSSRGNALITQANADEKEPYLYAHDARSGELISELRLPGAAFGALMTYRAGDKQYVVVPIGGAGLPAELVAVQVN
ncbi:pyrroloquinoline quinone-dependent dehydrogenase [Thauera mechernichensis]|uniref:Pyrroloquinoline quinone-dependent dehydrogenase n=1 Tax=Thauera mechernichensis TaxID=82788 RepID=A0ABW3W8J2_9RHOO|nr:pyrroloquinoline quinone-dependent dehydrogenase [Thauera mechernichensis]MDG3064459.1 pyrroloquinoline quinone-dependent dehydrogenase [Thauera mechernichensis]